MHVLQRPNYAAHHQKHRNSTRKRVVESAGADKRALIPVVGNKRVIGARNGAGGIIADRFVSHPHRHATRAVVLTCAANEASQVVIACRNVALGVAALRDCSECASITAACLASTTLTSCGGDVRLSSFNTGTTHL